MRHILKTFFCLALLTCLSIVQATSIIIPRSQSVNAARELVGWQQFINRADTDCNLYGAFAFTAEWQKSFRGAHLMQYLFNDDITLINPPNSFGCCDSDDRCDSVAQLKVQGSCVTSRDPHAWLADYFGLPTDFNGVVNFRPKIQNAIFDFNVYLGLDNWMQGLFFRIHAPVVRTKWNIDATETVIAPGVNNYFAGYMSGAVLVSNFSDSIGIRNASLRKSFLSAIDGTYTFGDMQSPLAYGRFCGNAADCSSEGCEACGLSSTSANDCCSNCTGSKCLVKLSDLEMAFGYNFVQCEDYHLGLELRGSAPTGNKPCGVCLFEPIVGNGKFWTLGIGLTAHTVLWRDCECPDRSLSFYIDANITHLFKSCQRRSLDLANKPNSRYMLVEQFGPPTTAGSTGGALFSQPLFVAGAASTPATTQYNGHLFPLINVATFNADVSYAAQGDVALKFSYMTGGWEFDVGYEFWGRSKEKVCLKPNAFPEKTYALKGDAVIYGFGATNSSQPNATIRLAATESNATIHSGTNFGLAGKNCIDGSEFTAAVLNLTIDNRADAVTANPPGANDRIQLFNNFGASATFQQHTSNPPVFIKATDFVGDCDGTKAITHKIFGNISHSWECNCWTPFIGVGGEVEFAQGSNESACCDSSSCNDICAISQWGIWIKGGVAFN